MSYEVKDPDGHYAGALRTHGMQVDNIAMELILSTVKMVSEKNGDVTVSELNDLKKEIEEAMRPQMPQMPGMQKVPN